MEDRTAGSTGSRTARDAGHREPEEEAWTDSREQSRGHSLGGKWGEGWKGGQGTDVTALSSPGVSGRVRCGQTGGDPDTEGRGLT